MHILTFNFRKNAHIYVIIYKEYFGLLMSCELYIIYIAKKNQSALKKS